MLKNWGDLNRQGWSRLSCYNTYIWTIDGEHLNFFLIINLYMFKQKKMHPNRCPKKSILMLTCVTKAE